MDKLKVLIRPVETADVNFIFNSWLKSYRHGSYFAKKIRDTVFYKYHHMVCDAILRRPTTRVLMACDPEDPSVIYGYLVYEKLNTDLHNWGYVLHYAYVKSPFRKLGVGAELLKASELDPNRCALSHWTMDTDFIAKKFPEITYTPYLI